MKDLLKILPMIDPLVLLEITGSQIIRCLENGVSMHPKLEGRFPQVTHFFIHIYPACLCDFKMDKWKFAYIKYVMVFARISIAFFVMF